jgi:hypothetical protein
MSHRIVAEDPVTDRFGPRSIPMSIAFAKWPDTAEECSAPAPISPTGRLLIRFEATAKPKAAVRFAASGGHSVSLSRKFRAS